MTCTIHECPPRTIVVPGLRSAASDDWELLWSGMLPEFDYVNMPDGVKPPIRAQWVDHLADAILAARGPVVVVAHCLGSLATVHLPEQISSRIRAAMFVAPVDPDCRGTFLDFFPVPSRRLNYHSLVVASKQDPYCSVRMAASFSRAWGSDFLRLNKPGYLTAADADSGWPLGKFLLEWLVSDIHKPTHDR